MISDLRATLQETHAPAARWTAMMAWLKRWWPALDPGAREEAIAYLSGHADRLADAERVAPDWLARELLWCPDSSLGVLPRRLRADISQHAALRPVLGRWPSLRVCLDAQHVSEEIRELPPAQVVALRWYEPTVGEVSTAQLEWLGELRGLESLEVSALSMGLAGWALDAVRASSETLRTLRWDAPLEPHMIEALAEARALESLRWGGDMPTFYRAGTAEAHEQAELIGQATWAPSLRAMRVSDEGVFAHHWRQLYPERLAARLTECEVWGGQHPRFDRASWLAFLGRFTALERLELGFWHEPGDDLFAPDVLGARLGALKALGCGRANDALVDALCALETTALDELSLSSMSAGGMTRACRWLAEARPKLRRLEISGAHAPAAWGWLARAAQAGAFERLEALPGDGEAQDALLSWWASAPGCTPALRSLTLDSLEPDEIDARAQALIGPPPALEHLSVEAQLGHAALDRLLGWLGGESLVCVEVDGGALGASGLRALARGEGAAALEELRCWSLTTPPDAQAWHDLLSAAPWLQLITVEGVALTPDAAPALLLAPALEQLHLDPADDALMVALRDALGASNTPLRLREITLVPPQEQASPAWRALASEIVAHLRARAPRARVRWSIGGGFEALA